MEDKKTIKKSHSDTPSLRLKKGEYVEAVGRRKTSTARVRIFKSEKNGVELIVNDKPFEKYFPLGNLQRIVKSPFDKIGISDIKATIKVLGGGISSQAQAIRHGIARALVVADEELRKKIKKFGFLTRDPRAVERKKYGLKKARRAPQWSKR